MWTAVLFIHITSGTLALLAGPVAMLLPKRRGWHTRLGSGYVVLVAVLSVSAIGLAIMKPALWWLGVVAGATLAAVLAGRELRRRRPPGWLPLHISLMCGSYVSLTTALFVVNLGFGSVLAWTLPTVVGTPLIARRAYLAAANLPGQRFVGGGDAQHRDLAGGDEPDQERQRVLAAGERDEGGDAIGL
jgi:uncharacterized membrane protein